MLIPIYDDVTSTVDLYIIKYDEGRSNLCTLQETTVQFSTVTGENAKRSRLETGIRTAYFKTRYGRVVQNNTITFGLDNIKKNNFVHFTFFQTRFRPTGPSLLTIKLLLGSTIHI
jgi:hypothetical protein